MRQGRDRIAIAVNMDWKAVSNYVLLVGLFVAMGTMFNQVNGRLDAMNERMDRVQSAIAVLDGRVSRIEGWIEGRFDTQSTLVPPASEGEGQSTP